MKLIDIELVKVVRERYNFQSEVVPQPITVNTLLCGAKREKVLPKKAANMLKEQFGKAVPCRALAAAHLGKTATCTVILA